MAEFKFTKSQEMAINSRGSSVLVSAAAGSGKTRVLTERLMSYITDRENPVDIDKFLVITYTRAAAAELRARILTELIGRRSKEPENRRLRRQVNLCYRAQIGTIHSFCTSVLRENAHLIGFSPDFKVGDEDKIQSIKLRALDQVLDKAYEDGDEQFFALANTIGSGRDDRKLEDTILDLYGKMQSQPDPELWAEIQKKRCKLEGISDISQTIWGGYLLNETVRALEFWEAEMQKLVELMHSRPEYEPIANAYSESVADTELFIRDASRQILQGWDAMKSHFPIGFPKLKSLRKPEFPEVADYIKNRRKACKTALDKIAISFDMDSTLAISDMKKMSIPLAKLLDLTIELDRVFKAEKKRQNLVDFSDLEHMSAKLLCDEYGKRSELAKQIANKYTEIMVDEFQDVNAVQERIVSSISKKETNIFMVGDVKQSIYRFRLADPMIFLEKYQQFEHADTAAKGEPRKILLSENFRSRDCVLKSANQVFTNIMSEDLGELCYDDEAMLKCGADYYDENYENQAELLIVELPQNTDEETPAKEKIEALAVAKKIRELVKNGEKVQGKDGMRPLKYSDIAVLIRSVNTVRATYAMAFAEVGVPLADAKGESFFKSPEISAMISMLAIIDNPHQDVPLIATLRSNFFHFSPDELAEIRSKNKKGSFYDALVEYAKNNTKTADFLTKLAKLRIIASDLPTDELISQLYNETEAMMILSAMDDGERKTQNLMQLLEYAKKFESEGFRGLFKFVALLRRMMERGEEPNFQAAGGMDAVSIMSIHKSKGLEFPYIFLCTTGKKFNKQDLRKTVLVHGDLGLGVNIIDADRGIEYSSIAKRAIASKLNTELLSEEMRVLYVALTRAKERIFVTAAMKKPEEEIKKIALTNEGPIAPIILESAQSMAQWLIQTASLNDSEMSISIINPESEEQVGESVQNEQKEAKPELISLLKKRIEFEYSHENCINIPSKLTATEIKHSEAIPETDTKLLTTKKRSNIFALPELGVERELTGAERGTATHVVMQYIDFAKTQSIEKIEGEIARLQTEGYINERQANALMPEHIKAFFDSELGERLAAADEVHRELPFSLLCRASDYYNIETDDEILLQGVLDCCIIEDGKVTIIDYKTDYVNQDRLPELVENYSAQVKAYAKAMSRIMQKEVGETVLFFLRAGIGTVLDKEGKQIRILR